ncbi:MAG: T9SS type A sorting domain-containing protein [Bacteroidia bacterium]|jgi:hypothetical protein|nr:T9SS type A sorting domain-containing protein [Bacteroidia bacterium]MBP7260968.1 T9SS type A sorting domain-containing protein [Bacteroidia bacterium]MBP9180447.1 T9SS type A sorting domain-containing protein [Bacteroidia bacterium]MBP9723594.1 T9SS type A sorting domain-containing protein [Bacteroidia bacterium]
MNKFIYLLLSILYCFKVYAQNSFEVRLTGWKPVIGIQLPDSSYRVITNGKEYGPEFMKMEVHNISLSGVQTENFGITIPDCADNTIDDAVVDNKGYLYVSGESSACPIDVQFLYVLNAAADSVKYIEHDTSKALSNYYRLSVNAQGSLMSTYGNRIFIYNNAHQKILITDTLPFKYGIVLQKANNSGYIALYNGTVVDINANGTIAGSLNFSAIDTTATNFTFSEVKLIETTGNILVNYRKYNPVDSQWTDAIALLDVNLNRKWVYTIPNTVARLQMKYKLKTLCVVRPDNTLLVIKHEDTQVSFPSRKLLLHHIDFMGSLFKVDTLLLKVSESAKSNVTILVSAVNTFDRGLLLTVNQYMDDGARYKGSPYLIKTDSNLKLPHRINTSVGSGLYNTSLNIYPNPNNTNQLHIIFPEQYNSNENVEVTFYNAMGQQVKFLKGDVEELNEVDIGPLANGCYVMEVRCANNTFYRTKLLRSGGYR